MEEQQVLWNLPKEYTFQDLRHCKLGQVDAVLSKGDLGLKIEMKASNGSATRTRSGETEFSFQRHGHGVITLDEVRNTFYRSWLVRRSFSVVLLLPCILSLP